jgi:GT2 family glycosyltransferase
MRIAVVVVTYNRAEELKKTLEAIAGQGIDSKDIIVVNNNSTDNTLAVLSNSFPGVQAVHLPDNIASAGGFSVGMKKAHEAGYDWAWLFNDDSRPVADVLKIASSYLANNKLNIGLLKVANTNDEGKAVLLYWKGVRVPKYVDRSDELIATDLVTFDGCFISGKLMQAIGYCDPLYFMGTYEFDYCLKTTKAGFGIYTLPNGLIEDGKLGSQSGTPPWRQYYNTRNHLWLALNLRSFQTLRGWLVRELKYTYAILTAGDRKGERMLFKARAIRDAVLGRRGKVYTPATSSIPKSA